jgi:hypothetical protein
MRVWLASPNAGPGLNFSAGSGGLVVQLPPETCAGPRTTVPFWTMATFSDTLSKPASSTELPIAVN